MAPRQCGLFFIAGADTPQQRAPLQSINVSATTCGPIAHNVIKFNYKNTNNTAIQSKFIFPVNSLSCIYHLSANVGGRAITGQVQEKKAAQEKYDEAVASGKSAVLAKESKEASDIIELELGAFGANEEAEVTVKEVFEMKLQKNGSQFQYKFPTSLFVRYGDTITAAASQNAPTEYVLNFGLKSHRGVNKIKPKPWLGIETNGDTFGFQGNKKVFEKDHDVVLDLSLATDFKGVKMTENWQDLTIINPEDRKTDVMIMLSSFLVHVASTPISELPAKEYVFVVDCSGSMDDGERIQSAGKTLQLLINSLPVGSFFNIVRFGSSYESLFSKTKEYNKENKEIAIKLAETLAADLGGTELYNCLKFVVESKRQVVNYKRQIFVLTDGDIGEQERTLNLVKKHAKENRFFSFGIGSGCSSALVNGLADAGLGSASFIDDKGSFEWEKQENMSSICIKSLVASASQHISKVDITPLPKSPKERISMVVDSTCLNVFHEGCPTDTTLQITFANNQEEYTVTTQNMRDIETIESPFEPNVLHKLAAKKLIGEMVRETLSNPYGGGKKQDIIDLSVKEQVLSPYTALVGVADEKTVVGVSQRVDVGYECDYEEDFVYDCVDYGMQLQSCSMYEMDEYSLDCAISESYVESPPMMPRTAKMRSMNVPCAMIESDESEDESPPMRRSKMKGGDEAVSACIAGPPREMATVSTEKKKNKGSLIQSLVKSASKGMSKMKGKSSKKMASDAQDVTMKIASSDEEIASAQYIEDDSSEYLEEEQFACRVENYSSMLSKEYVSQEPPTSTESPVLTYQLITNRQNPSGEWSDKLHSEQGDNVFNNIETVYEDKAVQFTFYAILLLLVEFEEAFDEWKLAAIKGVNFLKKFVPNLEGEVSKLLELSGFEVDEDILGELLA